jgi:hypothetical protein
MARLISILTLENYRVIRGELSNRSANPNWPIINLQHLATPSVAIESASPKMKGNTRNV